MADEDLKMPEGVTTVGPAIPKGGDPSMMPGVTSEGRATPERGLGQRIKERFWGTDIEKDPQQWTRMGAVVTGSILMGSVGSRFPLNPIAGALVGSAVGAAAGAVLPESLMDLGEAVGVLPPGYRDARGLNSRELRTVMEGEALLDLATGGGIFAARLASRSLSRWFVKPGKEGREVAEAALRNNVAVLPVMVGNRKLPRQMVSVFGRFPFLFSKYKSRALAAQSDLARAYSALPSRIAPMAAMSPQAVNLMTGEAQGFLRGVANSFDAEYAKLFAKADAAGIRVAPTATTGRAKDILENIARTTPKAATGEMLEHTKEMQAVSDFLSTHIAPLQKADPATGTIYTANQTMSSMDTLLTKIEDQQAIFVKAGQFEAANMLGDVKTQLLLDMNQNAKGAGVTAIMQEYRTLDRAYSQTMQELFEHSVSRTFGGVRRRGVAGVIYNDPHTVPVDRLAESLMRMGSADAVDQLSKLVTKQTFAEVTANVLDAKIQSAWRYAQDGTRTFDDIAFAQAMGIDNPNSPLYQTMSAMLDKAGGLRMKEVEDLMKVSAAVRSVEIPNVSTFLARRAGMGGISGVVNAVMPGVVAAGSAAGASAFNGASLGITGLVAGLSFVGGNKLMARAISNPMTAQLLRNVMKQEVGTRLLPNAGTMRGKALLVKVARLAIWAEMQREITEASSDGGTPSATTTRDAKSIREYWMEREDALVDFMDEWFTQGQQELRRNGLAK